MVRADVDVDNGSAGSTVKFYTSTDDGTTWTQLGADVVTAGVATIFASTANFSIGGRGATPTDFLSGTFYWVEAWQVTTTGRQSLVPPLPDSWEQITTANSVQYVGAPVILAVCGSVSGQNTTYFNDTARKLRLCSPMGQDVVFLSTGHNESGTRSAFWTTYQTWITDLKARFPDTPLVVVSQNPPASGGTLFSSVRQAQQRFQRTAWLMSKVASVAGVYPLNVWPAFANPSNPSNPLESSWLLSALLELDGVHPRQATWQLGQSESVASADTSGSYAWGQYVFSKLFA